MKKHILCFGDSNTHGYCADRRDSADFGERFNEEERWTCLLQQMLGDAYLVIEEGLSGRTTVFEDPLREGASGLKALKPTLESHKPLDLLILMLGTNDCKQRFSNNAYTIAMGMERLITLAQSLPVWTYDVPNILVIAPPPIEEAMLKSPAVEDMGPQALELSRKLAKKYAFACLAHRCQFLDASGIGEMNPVDGMHLTREGHRKLAEKLAQLIPGLLENG